MPTDFGLLEEVSRAEDIARRSRPAAPKPQLPPALASLVFQASRRDTRLLIMPPGGWWCMGVVIRVHGAWCMGDAAGGKS